MNAHRVKILGIGGTTRRGSSSEKALSISLQAAAAVGAETILLSGSDLLVPMYSPDERKRTPEAKHLVDAFRDCDDVIISSAAYHGSISGLVKNALDYVEDLRDGERVYFDGIAAGLIACGGGWQASGQNLTALRSVAHALRAWPTPFGAMLNTSLNLFDDSGQCLEQSVRLQLETIGKHVVEFAEMAAAYRSRSLVDCALCEIGPMHSALRQEIFNFRQAATRVSEDGMVRRENGDHYYIHTTTLGQKAEYERRCNQEYRSRSWRDYRFGYCDVGALLLSTPWANVI